MCFYLYMLTKKFYLSFCRSTIFSVTFLSLDKKVTKEPSEEGDTPSSMTPCCASAGIADANRSDMLKLPPAGHKYTPQATAELKSVVRIIVGYLINFFALYIILLCSRRTPFGDIINFRRADVRVANRRPPLRDRSDLFVRWNVCPKSKGFN